MSRFGIQNTEFLNATDETAFGRRMQRLRVALAREGQVRSTGKTIKQHAAASEETFTEFLARAERER